MQDRTNRVEAHSVTELDALLSSSAASQQHVLLFFWAGWSEACRDMEPVLQAVEVEYGSALKVVGVEAEKATDVSLRYAVQAVPLCILVWQEKEVERVQGMDPIELQDKLASRLGASPIAEQGRSQKMSLDERLDMLVNQSPVMLFMKGSPDAPRCGFSQKAVQALRDAGCTAFGHFDILEDQEVRQGLKEKSQWPTYPQLYVKGELVGGCDIILEMSKDGSLAEEINK
ncbi:hypothetical protein M9434_004914 [Picochlorum sp. BPE23]|nr:hypothetical protein M9435_001685 [Picochlorum sp. BPE23]KAI8111342.1 hypothetical protein M9434_004914 [Picochlorum sp. BPE23]